MSGPLRAVVVGSINLDCTATGPHMPRPGESVLGSRFALRPGGKGANQAVQLGRLGCQTAMVGCVGDDAPGRLLYGMLAREPLDLAHVHTCAGVPSGGCCIHVDAQAENAILAVPGANDCLTPEMVDAAGGAIAEAGVLLVQNEVPVPTIRRALELARSCGVPTIWNPAPVRACDPALFALADWLTPNEQEAEQLSGVSRKGLAVEQWAAAAAAALLRFGAARVVITLGSRGAFFAGGGQSGLIPACRAKAVDTTGAGDSFNGALGFAVQQWPGDWQHCVKFACAAGAVCAEHPGAFAAMGTLEQVTARMKGEGV